MHQKPQGIPYCPLEQSGMAHKSQNTPSTHHVLCEMAANPSPVAQESFGFTKDTEQLARRPSFSNSLNTEIKQHQTNPEKGKTGNGFLLKRSSAGNYNKRWVVVHGHYLSYFKANPSNLSPKDRIPLGALDLWQVEAVSLDDNVINLRLSPHALQARLEEMGGDRAKKLIATTPLGRTMAKRLDLARRGGGLLNQHFVFKAPNTREAQRWLTIMRESPLLGSLTGLHKALAEEGGFTVKELRLQMPPKREFIFADASSIFEGDTEILLRNVPMSGSNITVVLTSGKEEQASTIEGSALFEPSIGDASGKIIMYFPAGINVDISWERKYYPKSRAVAMGAAVFGLVSFISLLYLRQLKMSVIVGFLCGAGTAYSVWQQDAARNDVVIRMVTVVKPRGTDASSPVSSPKAGERKAVSTNLDEYVATDPHITKEEARMIAELRLRLQDMWDIPPNADAFIKKHEKFLREWHADINALKNPEKIKRTMDKHILEDFRLVRYIRARKHKIGKAEHMIRDSLIWRVALGSDYILEDKELGVPPEWICRYFGSRDIMTMIRPEEDTDLRLKTFFVRDREGHLGLFFRSGRMNSRKIFKKMSSKVCYMIKMVVWSSELLRRDLERHREQNPDKPETVLSVIVDLEGFAISEQIPLTDLLPLARRFFPIFSTSYPELLNRVLVFNAPWLFGSLWNAIKPFIPEEVQEKIQIHSGEINFQKHINPYFEPKYVPKYFGGTMVDKTDGNEYCLDIVAPFGPYGYPDEGAELLKGIDEKSQTW